jgi:2-dehydropantoate 2-reductase
MSSARRESLSTSGSKGSIERICIVGPGAMGLLHAAYLKRAGLNVHLLDYNRARAERLNREKIILADAPEALDIPCHATPDFGPVDLLIVCVKAYSTATAAEHAAPLMGDDTVLLSLQNGLGNLEIIEQYQRLGLVLLGTTTSGATLVDFNVVRQEGLGDIQIGSPLLGARASLPAFSEAGRDARAPRQTTTAVRAAPAPRARPAVGRPPSPATEAGGPTAPPRR